MDVNAIPALSGEEEQSTGLYKYQAPGTSGLFPNSPMELMGEGKQPTDYKNYR